MGKNRFTERQNNISELNQNDLLLQIMQSEFPDDPVYSQGTLSQSEVTALAHTASFTVNRQFMDEMYAKRNGNNILDVYSTVEQYTEYSVDTTIPTIDERTLDDLLDDEWNYFVTQDKLRQPVTTGLFIVPFENQLNPIDFHDAYIQQGPENLNALMLQNSNDTDITNLVFCVYYIDNDIAYPIPNYKTLEVMLVERGLTYSNIKEATKDQLTHFDMRFDGKFQGDQTPNTAADPIEEFNFRKLADRSTDWNLRIRLASGYKPKAPFKRDPGDYIKPIGYRGTGATDLYVLEDPNDRYFDLVFQGQTYKEKLREKYEGKMIIDKWPVPYDNNEVVQNATISSDDLVFGVRMMINGYWKGIASSTQGGLGLFEAYAQTNGYSLKEFQPGQGRYGERGYINLLLNQGGLTVLHVQDDERPAPVWDDFAHIAEVDVLDLIEYLDYIDNYSNNGQPFDIDYINPYEPKGSIHYYKQLQLDKLQQQAIEQAQFENVRDQILEYWPRLAAKTQEFTNRINGIQSSAFSSYFAQKLGPNCPSYKIITADEPWKYVKKKRGDLKVKDEETNLLALFEKSTRISANFDKDEENRIVYEGKWGKVNTIIIDELDKIDIKQVYADDLPILINNGKYELPRDLDNSRAKRLMRSAKYINVMIATELNSRIKSIDLHTRVEYADSVINELRQSIDEANQLLLDLDDRLVNATESSELQDIYTSIMELYNFLNSVSETDLQYCIDTKQAIDNMLKTHILDMYKSIEYFRQKVQDEVGNRGKFGIKWPESAKAIVNAYAPGKSFDNYLPESE